MSHVLAPSSRTAHAGGEARLLLRALLDAGDRHRLLVRFALLDLAGAALVAVAWLQGWVRLLWEADVTGLVSAIAAVFAVGIVWCGARILAVDRGLDGFARGRIDPATPWGRFLERARGRAPERVGRLAEALRARLLAANAPVRFLSNALVLLGLIGTVVGFVLALSGIDATAAQDVSGVAPMIARLVTGLSVALHTTLVGSVLHLWLGAALRLLDAGTAELYARALEEVRDAGS